MSMSRLFLSVVAALAMPCAIGQQMYKVVGADGKITFSDRPALHKEAKVSVMQSYTLRPYVTAQTAAEMAAAATARRAAAAKSAASAPGTVEEAPVLTQEVSDAVVTVMGQVEFARRFYNSCNGNLAGAKAFSTAARAWKERNAAAIAHQNRLIMEVVSPSKRDELQEKVAGMLEQENRKVVSQNPKERQAWCAGVVAELNSGKADIVQPAMMAVPIITYRGK
jgi:hypothetical protein